MAALKQLADIFISELPTVEEPKLVYSGQPRPAPEMRALLSTRQLHPTIPMQPRQPLPRVPLQQLE
eukprot:717446-Ditylum_brightwellii.AAC.1